MKIINALLIVGLAIAPTACERRPAIKQSSNSSENSQQGEPFSGIDSLKIVLLPQTGENRTDQQIRLFQDKVRQNQSRKNSLEHLGWMFIKKARETFDPGYYKLAEACADALVQDNPGCAEALLLHGFVFENLHRFKEAEPLARKLASSRGLPFDYGLLGDSLMEQGKLGEAAAAYQQMVDLRPDLESYARVAHLRWLKGDRDGAIEVMKAAVSASSPRDPESAAWVITHLGILEFSSGKNEQALAATTEALNMFPTYAPALLLRGRILLGTNKPEQAVEILKEAARINPLPEYQWTLAEALHASHQEKEAKAVESELTATGERNDPRTYALFLSTQNRDLPKAVQLLNVELGQRQDIFTQDAMAWALVANGQLEEAKKHMALALAEGTQDPRLFFHAAIIANQAGNIEVSRKWVSQVSPLMQALLPSEQMRLRSLSENFPTKINCQTVAR